MSRATAAMVRDSEGVELRSFMGAMLGCRTRSTGPALDTGGFVLDNY
jgi:hypothetical protein